MTGVWIYDIETLSNCFTYTALHRDTPEVVQFTIWKDINEIAELIEHLENCRGLIGFNNLSFDYPVLHYMMVHQEEWGELTGDEITALIYIKAQEAIDDEWSGIKDMYVKVPQLDLFRIWHYNNRAKMTSLKKLQIALRYPNVQDMPYAHYDIIENKEQVQEILDYNLNDVKATHDFFLKTLNKLELRKGLYKRYGLKCMNYPDSKIGEDLTLKLYCNEVGQRESHVRKQRTHRSHFKFRECFPDYTYFTTKEFKKLEIYLKGIEVEEIKGSFAYSFDYKGFQFDLGTGGIHGCIESGVYESTDTHIIVDIDVASLYPSLAIVNGLYPEHLGEEFVKVYDEGIVTPRLEAKRTGDTVMNHGFKLSANSVYGKSNSKFSWLYDPLYTIKTTLGGQLSLCMLSERLMSNVKDLTMLQINTDGLTAIIPKTEKRNFYNHCTKWESETNLVLEYASYKKMIIRDVNSYIAEDNKGYVKYKGAFKTYEQMIKEEEYHKAMSQTIVAHAISEFYLKSIPLEETVMGAENIYDFCKTFNASYGWKCEVVDDSGVVTKQQKTNRYYVSTEGIQFRKTKDVRVIDIEAGGTLITMFNTFVKKQMIDYNIDYDYYINECYKIVRKVDGSERRELEAHREAKRLDKQKREEANFIRYCWNKPPTERQLGLYGKEWLLEKYGTPTLKQLR